MRIAVIGAGPAGLTGAKQALSDGHDVVVYERNADIGGIWDPGSGGAYPGVRMQSSVMSFPFSDFPPVRTGDFPAAEQVHRYLTDYAAAFGVREVIRPGHRVARVTRLGEGRWQVTATHPAAGIAADAQTFDAVMVASGELWQPKRPPCVPGQGSGVRVLTAKDYRGPADFHGKRVLVVGGGVSGADIGADLTRAAASVDWSVRRRALFLPRYCGAHFNDALFSYLGRVAIESYDYADYLRWLERLMPSYMGAYRATGLLPADGFHGAVHVNEKIIPLVHAGAVRARPAFAAFEGAAVRFSDGSRHSYDAVVLCLGYEMPDYGFIDGLRREDLYEHHFFTHDPTLAVINTPVDGEGFGTACPYFEAIAGWALAVFSGKVELPGPAQRARWCAEHLHRLDRKRYLDCWLETIRIGLRSGALPDPATDFAGYWTVVASVVAPANLCAATAVHRPAVGDSLFDLGAIRHRLLAHLPLAARDFLLADGQITAAEHAAAAALPAGQALPAWLPYRQR